MADLTTVAGCSAALQLGQISAVELTQECLRSIAVHNPTLNAFITTAEQRGSSKRGRLISDERREHNHPSQVCQ